MNCHRSVAMFLGVFILYSCSSEDEAFRTWRSYAGDPGASRYSSLTQINRGNVARLKVAWVHKTGDTWERSQIQTNPIAVDSIIYAVSAGLRAIALHAGTGKRLWTFDPWVADSSGQASQGVNRGLIYWEDGDGKRIFFNAAARMYALDARSVKPIPDFGKEGWIDYRDSLDRDASDLWVIATSPGVIYEDLLIQGTRVSEGLVAAPGHIRAYDIHTGEIRWTFHTIPHPGEYGYETWPPHAWKVFGGANSWPGMALDKKHGMVFIPTGSASYDYYGGNRPGENLFANCLLALDARTGKRLWHFQTVHHDIFDRDHPATPNLVTVTHNGRKVDAVAQITKQGMVFLFNRETGAPLFEIEERPMPPSDLIGEMAWPTQPFPVKPPPYARQNYTEAEISDISQASYDFIKSELQNVKAGGPYFPPREGSSLFLPGLDGGAEWGGAAVDPNGILYLNATDMPWIIKTQPPKPTNGQAPQTGREAYMNYCATCHLANLKGDGGRNPTLLGLKERMNQEQVLTLIESGRGFMPSFRMLNAPEKSAILSYVLETDSITVSVEHTEEEMVDRALKIPYGWISAARFKDQNGYPAIKPPWGTLTAIDLNTGDFKWRVPLGEIEELTARGIPRTGTENYGGPVVTAGGLLFIGATPDEKFRAFDIGTGDILWETDLPAGGYATPATYEYNGKQYVVIACGGGKMGTKRGDAYVAFSLSDL